MKHIIRILVLAVSLFVGLTTISAQTVQVQLIKKYPSKPLPATILSYMDNPFRYFEIRFILTGAGAEGLDIFFDMDLSVSTSNLFVHTSPNAEPPMQCIHLNEGINRMTAEQLNPQVLSRLDTNFDYSDPFNAQQLPEGTYQLCVDVYRWSDRYNPARESISVGGCPTFEICYSGSAPELVSPMAGAQIALNGALVVTPNRKINFFWTPVISNCTSRTTNFKYKLKVVKVLKGQNYQDAIKYNPTVLSTELKNKNYAVFDTLRDVKVQMEKGALYVAQVQAEKIQSGRAGEVFIIANEGKSQPLPFFWDAYDSFIGSIPEGEGAGGTKDPFYFPYNGAFGGPSGPNTSPKNKSKRTYGYTVEDESQEGIESEGIAGLTIWEGGVEEVSELETIGEEIKEQYLTSFILDDATVANLTKTYPEEWKYVPTPKRRYVESDGYYTVPMTDDLEISFMPARHKALKNVSYELALYDYIKGADIDSITSNEPLFRERIEEVPESYSKMDSHELISRTLDGWGTELIQGNRYYLQLSSFYTVDYWKYVVADTNFYVNEQLAEHIHDTTSREFVHEKLGHSNGVYFQWGENSSVTKFTTPQWKAPVDRTKDDIYDPANYARPTSIPEVRLIKAFPISWTPIKNMDKKDKVEYEVNVYELKPGQTVDEAIASNTVLVSRTVTNANKISEDDMKFFKVFSSQKTYVMTLSTNVTGDSDILYHFENGNKALPIIFKILK